MSSYEVPDQANHGSAKQTIRYQSPDIVVSVGSGSSAQEFECYGLMLSSASPYLDAMLSTKMKEGENGFISFPDKNPNEWKLFYEFVDPQTARHARIDRENVFMLLPWFHEFQMATCVNECDECILQKCLVHPKVVTTAQDKLLFSMQQRFPLFKQPPVPPHRQSNPFSQPPSGPFNPHWNDTRHQSSLLRNDTNPSDQCLFRQFTSPIRQEAASLNSQEVTSLNSFWMKSRDDNENNVNYRSRLAKRWENFSNIVHIIDLSHKYGLEKTKSEVHKSMALIMSSIVHTYDLFDFSTVKFLLDLVLPLKLDDTGIRMERRECSHIWPEIEKILSPHTATLSQELVDDTKAFPVLFYSFLQNKVQGEKLNAAKKIINVVSVTNRHIHNDESQRLKREYDAKKQYFKSLGITSVEYSGIE